MKRKLESAYNLFKAFYNYNHHKLVLSNYPLITLIEITNRCNLRCGFCARDAVKRHRGFGDMTLQQYKYILNKYSKSIRHLRIFLHGEPTLHPDLITMIRYARQTGAASVGFTTNGVLVTKNKFLEMAKAGLTVIAFSFEGVTPEIYEKLRVGAKYETVKKNILDACITKTQLNLNVDISINIIDSALTRPGLPKFLREWSRVDGLNRVDVSRLHDWVKNTDVTALQPQLPSWLPRVCPAPWFETVIQYNGNITPCCAWLYKPLGNIFTDDLYTVWNNAEFVNLRRQLIAGRYTHRYCKNCTSLPFSEGSYYMVKETNPYYPLSRNFWDVFIRKRIKHD